MRVISEGIVDGVIQDPYGKRGTQFSAHGVPACSLPFEILDPPAGTRSYAFVLEDKDAVPVTRGFSWIHWTGCNLTEPRVEADASRRSPAFVQGLNSWTSVQGGSLPPEACCCYGGMGPPDRPHVYELHVYALDTRLDLAAGFWMNELYRAMEGHVLDSATLRGIYSS